jgi:phosphatidylserine decarboxylase
MIPYYNRVTQKIENEQVYGGAYLDWAYQNPIGFFLTDHVLSKRWVSRLFGAFEDSSFSRAKIKNFVEKYNIPMEDFEDASYSCFNDFFIRKFKSGKRPFSNSNTQFAAGAEARYLAFTDLKADQRFAIKGIDINLEDLLQDKDLAKTFLGGTLLIARLCPVDYHRFHFPFSGKLTRHYPVAGQYHSVNPVALKAAPRVFLENERQIAILEHDFFGKCAMIEVGALGVGKIVQSAYNSKTSLPLAFEMGSEKGYFLFGGSTVIWLIEHGKIKLCEDLLINSARGIETWIPLGQTLGEVNSSEQRPSPH